MSLPSQTKFKHGGLSSEARKRGTGDCNPAQTCLVNSKERSCILQHQTHMRPCLFSSSLAHMHWRDEARRGHSDRVYALFHHTNFRWMRGCIHGMGCASHKHLRGTRTCVATQPYHFEHKHRSQNASGRILVISHLGMYAQVCFAPNERTLTVAQINNDNHAGRVSHVRNVLGSSQISRASKIAENHVQFCSWTRKGAHNWICAVNIAQNFCDDAVKITQISSTGGLTQAPYTCGDSRRAGCRIANHVFVGGMPCVVYPCCALDTMSKASSQLVVKGLDWRGGLDMVGGGLSLPLLQVIFAWWMGKGLDWRVAVWKGFGGHIATNSEVMYSGHGGQYSAACYDSCASSPVLYSNGRTAMYSMHHVQPFYQQAMSDHTCRCAAATQIHVAHLACYASIWQQPIARVHHCVNKRFRLNIVSQDQTSASSRFAMSGKDQSWQKSNWGASSSQGWNKSPNWDSDHSNRQGKWSDNRSSGSLESAERRIHPGHKNRAYTYDEFLEFTHQNVQFANQMWDEATPYVQDSKPARWDKRKSDRPKQSSDSRAWNNWKDQSTSTKRVQNRDDDQRAQGVEARKSQPTKDDWANESDPGPKRGKSSDGLPNPLSSTPQGPHNSGIVASNLPNDGDIAPPESDDGLDASDGPMKWTTDCEKAIASRMVKKLCSEYNLVPCKDDERAQCAQCLRRYVNRSGRQYHKIVDLPHGTICDRPACIAKLYSAVSETPAEWPSEIHKPKADGFVESHHPQIIIQKVRKYTEHFNPVSGSTHWCVQEAKCEVLEFSTNNCPEIVPRVYRTGKGPICDELADTLKWMKDRRHTPTGRAASLLPTFLEPQTDIADRRHHYTFLDHEYRLMYAISEVDQLLLKHTALTKEPVLLEADDKRAAECIDPQSQLYGTAKLARDGCNMNSMVTDKIVPTAAIVTIRKGIGLQLFKVSIETLNSVLLALREAAKFIGDTKYSRPFYADICVTGVDMDAWSKNVALRVPKRDPRAIALSQIFEPCAPEPPLSFSSDDWLESTEGEPLLPKLDRNKYPGRPFGQDPKLSCPKRARHQLSQIWSLFYRLAEEDVNGHAVAQECVKGAVQMLHADGASDTKTDLEKATEEFTCTKFIWQALDIKTMLVMGTQLCAMNSSVARVEMRRLLIEVITWAGGSYFDWSNAYTRTMSGGPSLHQQLQMSNQRAVANFDDYSGLIDLRNKVSMHNYVVEPTRVSEATDNTFVRHVECSNMTGINEDKIQGYLGKQASNRRIRSLITQIEAKNPCSASTDRNLGCSPGINFIDEITPKFRQSAHCEQSLSVLIVVTEDGQLPKSIDIKGVACAIYGTHEICVEHAATGTCPKAVIRFDGGQAAVTVCEKAHLPTYMSNEQKVLLDEALQGTTSMHDEGGKLVRKGFSRLACPVDCDQSKSCMWTPKSKAMKFRRGDRDRQTIIEGGCAQICADYSNNGCGYPNCTNSHAGTGTSVSYNSSQLTPKPECQAALFNKCTTAHGSIFATHSLAEVEQTRAIRQCQQATSAFLESYKEAVESYGAYLTDPNVLADADPSTHTAVLIVPVAKIEQIELYEQAYAPSTVYDAQPTQILDAFNRTHVADTRESPFNQDGRIQASLNNTTFAVSVEVQNRAVEYAFVRANNKTSVDACVARDTAAERSRDPHPIADLTGLEEYVEPPIDPEDVIKHDKWPSLIIVKDGVNHIKWPVLCPSCFYHGPTKAWYCGFCESDTPSNKLQLKRAETCTMCNNEGRGTAYTLLKGCGKKVNQAPTDVCLNPDCGLYAGPIPGRLAKVGPRNVMKIIQDHNGDLGAAQADERLGPALGPVCEYPKFMHIGKLTMSTECKNEVQVGDWRCRKCGMVNHRSQGKCECCSDPKPKIVKCIQPKPQPKSENGRYIDMQGYGCIVQHTLTRVKPGQLFTDPKPELQSLAVVTPDGAIELVTIPVKAMPGDWDTKFKRQPHYDVTDDAFKGIMGLKLPSKGYTIIRNEYCREHVARDRAYRVYEKDIMLHPNASLQPICNYSSLALQVCLDNDPKIEGALGRSTYAPIWIDSQTVNSIIRYQHTHRKSTVTAAVRSRAVFERVWDNIKAAVQTSQAMKVGEQYLTACFGTMTKGVKHELIQPDQLTVTDEQGVVLATEESDNKYFKLLPVAVNSEFFAIMAGRDPSVRADSAQTHSVAEDQLNLSMYQTEQLMTKHGVHFSIADEIQQSAVTMYESVQQRVGGQATQAMFMQHVIAMAQVTAESGPTRQIDPQIVEAHRDVLTYNHIRKRKAGSAQLNQEGLPKAPPTKVVVDLTATTADNVTEVSDRDRQKAQDTASSDSLPKFSVNTTVTDENGFTFASPFPSTASRTDEAAESETKDLYCTNLGCIFAIRRRCCDHGSQHSISHPIVMCAHLRTFREEKKRYAQRCEVYRLQDARRAKWKWLSCTYRERRKDSVWTCDAHALLQKHIAYCALLVMRGGTRGRLNVPWTQATRIGEADNPGPRPHNRHQRRHSKPPTDGQSFVAQGSRTGSCTEDEGRRETITISTYNGNCMNTACKWLAESRATVNAVQETKICGNKYKRMVKRLRQEGRTMIGTQALKGPKGGLTCGVAIVVDNCHDIFEPDPGSQIPKGEEHLIYEIIPGRAVAVVVSGWAKTRIMIVTVYLEVGEGMGVHNLATLYEVGNWVIRMGIPYVICGDFNNTVMEVEQLRWLEAIDGVVIAPSEPTQWTPSQKEGSIIDFFIVKRCLSSFAAAQTVQRAATPHRPVNLTIDLPRHQIYEYTIVKPLPFPTEVGTMVQQEITLAPNWCYDSFEEMYITNYSREPTIEEHARFIMDAIEDELIIRFGLEYTDQSDKPSQYRGRSDGFRVRRTPILPKQTSKGPETMRTVEEVHHFEQQLSQLASNLTRELIEDGYTRNNMQEVRVRPRPVGNSGLRDQASHVATHMESLQQKLPKQCQAGTILECMKGFVFHGFMTAEQISLIWQAHAEIKQWVDARKREAANERARNYRTFVKGAVNEKGAQILHKIAKVPALYLPTQVKSGDTTTTTDQANADHQRTIWKEVWNGTDSDESSNKKARWFGIHHRDKTMPSQQDIDNLRKTARSFKHTTAMSFDNLKPHLLAELSDEGIGQLIRFYRRCEDEGRWPQQWRHAIMVMIPKLKHGTYRLIAMLCAVYRLWARQAGKEVSRWMHSLNREWIAFGPNKAAEAAAYDIALTSECATGTQKHWAATVMSDLEKGFEKVKHEHLIVAAHVYDFPLRILRLAINMYKSPRRIRCGAAVCKPVYTSMGVLAGCPIAMGALCLAVLNPMDKLTREVPKGVADIKVYVDDFTIAHVVDGSHTAYDAAYKLQRIVCRLHELLDTVDLKCSSDKNVFMTNNPTYAVIVEHALEGWKYKREPTTKLLGVDFAGGGVVNYEHATKRLDKAKKAASELKVYDIKGVNITNAVRAHTAGCTQYSVMSVGMPCNILSQTATTLRATTSTVANGGSATLDLLTQKSRYLHPAYAAHTTPLIEWSQKLYMPNIEKNENTMGTIAKMRNAFDTQIAIFDDKKDLWKQVRGPATAVIATLLRIKWKPQAFDQWITETGEILDLNSVIPHLVLTKVREAVDKWLWNNCTVAKKFGCTDWHDIPNLKIARHVILGKDKSAGAMARSVTIGTQWPQSRIDTTKPQCKACNDPFWAGTMKHRNFPGVALCAHSREKITQHLDLDVIEMLRNKKGGEIMANHALLMESQTPKIPKVTEAEPKWFSDLVPRAFTGVGFTDGSASTNHCFTKARRAGWAAVVIAEELPIHSDDQSSEDRENHTVSNPSDNEDADNQAFSDTVTFKHPQNWWPVKVSKATGSIIRVYNADLAALGVDCEWRILTINGEDAYESPYEAIQRNMQAAAILTVKPNVETTFINAQLVEKEEAERRVCTCPNIANQWHTCTRWCADTYGCRGQCKRKVRRRKNKNREAPPQIIQAIWGPLKGEIQSTPRAELEAIAQMLEHAYPPICIYTDHDNHVKAFHRGRRYCCKPKSPFVDIWIRIWHAIYRLGRTNVELKWTPSHREADASETWAQRVERRGNSAADGKAVEARRSHDIPNEIGSELKKTEKMTKQYHKWTAFTAAAQHNGDLPIDHVKRDEHYQKKRSGRTKRATAAPDKQVLNRMPFAQRSQGMAVMHGPQSYGGIAGEQECAEIRMINVKQRLRSKVTVSGLETAKVNDTRPTSIFSIGTSITEVHKALVASTNPMPPEFTSGHSLMIAGDPDHPWVWCNTCGAYTNKAVRNLGKRCSGKGNLHVVNQLNRGFEPRINAPKCPKPKQCTSEMIDLLRSSFRNPAEFSNRRGEIAWAVYCKWKSNIDTLAINNWKQVTQEYNVRVHPNHRVTVAAMKRSIQQQRSILATEEQQLVVENDWSNTLLSTPPRPFAWEDAGGLPSVCNAQRDSSAGDINRTVRALTYMAAYRRLRKNEITALIAARNNGQQVLPDSGVHHRMGINALTGTRGTNNRRKCIIPKRVAHDPYLFVYRPRGSASVVHEHDEEDPFNHGGSLD